ncbi:mechanosensitive ion channel domain-containing protein [Novosphingobium olei]|uniref:Small-conductance mechanosensitive channel n=1 Tax=Novosphingobium olei TaxID=2728851 RepID=A0A7Y0BQN0_9SPHN|nr:mechanosensitive ion channel domain-containing protein [Novosphingobium olei]NML94510.1 mechanosensitive ion channel [Novosphingobium olei]
MRPVIRPLLALLLVSVAPPLLAQSSPSVLPSASAPPAQPSGEIATDEAVNDDAKVAQRIRTIFAEIPALQPVTVRVSAGVVTLTGTVADQAAIDQAASIAGRLSGVVTVQNRLDRNLQVERNLSPAVSGVTDRIVGLWRALPLIGVALLVAVMVGFAGYALAGRKRLWARVAPNPFLAELIETAIRFVFVVGGIVLALEILGATALLGAVLGGAGVIGIALGFAVRDSIDNYVSSLMLSVRQPFRANDSVRIDNHEGTVVRLTSRATILITGDGNHLRIPNSTVFKAVILNFTANPQRKFTFDYPLAQDADPCHARGVGLDVLRKLDFVLAKPEPGAELVDIAGATQVLRFGAWVDQQHSDFGKARTNAMEAVRHALREGGFPAALPGSRVRLERKDEDARSPAAPAPGAASVSASADVAPESHITQMAERERAGKKDGQDLLDTSRPVE